MVNLSAVLSTHLKRYEIKERLGAGGMASVYHAVDKNLGRDVAIKVLHEHLVYEESFKERFEQEARFIAGFNHPNIVRVYDFDTLELGEDIVYYMVMPYLPGATLVDILDDYRQREATLPHDRTLQIIKDLAAALDYAHDRTMIHRDVKPANIVFDENDNAILMDFGIARLAAKSNLTQEGNIIGTPSYMAPEQATGQPLDHRIDLYSLGVVLFEMLTGHPPFEDDGTVSVLIRHVRDEVPPVSTYLQTANDALDKVLHKALAKDPNSRYQSAAELFYELEIAISTETDTQRLKTGTLPASHAPKAPAATVQLEAPPQSQSVGNTLTRTFETVVLQPARKNPFGVIALVIALAALLIVARLSQNSTTPVETILADPTPLTVDTLNSIDSMTDDRLLFNSDFSDDDFYNSYWDQNTSGDEQRQISDGQYIIDNLDARNAMTAMFDTSYVYEDVHITMMATLSETSASPTSGYGLVFHYVDALNYYVFAVDGQGRYSLWVRMNGDWTELRDAGEQWTEHPAINPIGEPNEFELNVYGDSIVGYINQVEVVALRDSTFAEGGVGIYMASTSNGGASVSVDSYSVDLGMDSMTADSMTDDSMTGDSMTEDKDDSMTAEMTPEVTPETNAP